MEKGFWLERWKRQEIGFHQDEINPHLNRYWAELLPKPESEVFVPLCGKSRDMLWLRQQGHRVLGIELSAIAAQAFFDESGITPQREGSELFECYKSEGIRILCGDFFDLRQSDLANIGAVYDRASLIALPPDMRERYAQHLMAILPPATQILLITLEYPQHEMQGPPFAVTREEVEKLYGGHADVRLLAHLDVLAENPRFQERGLSQMMENIFLLRLQ